MTAQNSRIDFYNFKPYFLTKLKSLRGFAVVQAVLAVLAYPISTFMMRLYHETQEKYVEARNIVNDLTDFSGDYSQVIGTPEYIQMTEIGHRFQTISALFSFSVLLALVALVGIAVMHFVVQMKCFRWLYNKEMVDMDYSLPVSSDARFIADFFAGLMTAGVPHVLSIIAGTIILWGWSYPDSGISGYVFTEVACAGAAACLLFYCFNMLIISVCGKRDRMVVMAVLANFALPIMIMSGYAIVMICGYGNTVSDIYTNMSLAAGPFSPLSLVLAAIVSFDTTTEYIYGEMIHAGIPYILRPEVIIPVVVLSVGFFAAAWVLVKKRRAENVGNPFVFKPARHVVNIGFVLTLVLLFAMIILMQTAEGYWGGSSNVLQSVLCMITATFLAYIALELSAVGVKRFGLTILRWLGVMAGCGAGTLGLMSADGFGSGWAVPEEKDVNHVYYHVDGSSVASISSLGSFASDSSVIEQITQLHEQVPNLKDYSNVFEGISEGWLGDGNNKLSERGPVIYLRYYMKNGFTREFRYLVDEEFCERFVESVVLRQNLLEDFTAFNLSETNYLKEQNITAYSLAKCYDSERIPVEAFSSQELYDAAYADIKAVDISKLTETTAGEYSKELSFFMNGVCYDGDKIEPAFSAAIYPWMTNTIAILESHGISIDFTPLAVSQNNDVEVFLLKMNGVPEGATLAECGYYNENQLSRSRLDPLNNCGKMGMYAIAGDERCAQVIMTQEYFEPNEVFTCPDGTQLNQPFGYYISSAAYLSVAAVDKTSAELSELLSMAGSVCTLSQDTTKDAYALVFSIARKNLPVEEWIYDNSLLDICFITEDNAPRAAELFDRLSD